MTKVCTKCVAQAGFRCTTGTVGIFSRGYRELSSATEPLRFVGLHRCVPSSGASRRTTHQRLVLRLDVPDPAQRRCHFRRCRFYRTPLPAADWPVGSGNRRNLFSPSRRPRPLNLGKRHYQRRDGIAHHGAIGSRGLRRSSPSPSSGVHLTHGRPRHSPYLFGKGSSSPARPYGLGFCRCRNLPHPNRGL